MTDHYLPANACTPPKHPGAPHVAKRTCTKCGNAVSFATWGEACAATTRTPAPAAALCPCGVIRATCWRCSGPELLDAAWPADDFDVPDDEEPEDFADPDAHETEADLYKYWKP